MSSSLIHGSKGKDDTMPLQGKFVVDNNKIAILSIYGAGVFTAFSGNGIYRNRGGCTAVKDNGPLPAGKYWIVDRPAGGLLSQTEAFIASTTTRLRGSPSDRSEWFALYRDDGLIDDYTWINGVRRGNFRLHPIGASGNSFGCITLPSLANFETIRRALLHTTRIDAGRSGLKSYGWIEVIAHGNSCP
jgi:hypothetical protein